jgi:hypothetical protein
MVSDIRHYSKKMSRKANEGTTTRYIVVEEKSGVVLRSHPRSQTNKSQSKDGSTGYQYHAISREWFSKKASAWLK